MKHPNELPTSYRNKTEQAQELVDNGWQEDGGKWIKENGHPEEVFNSLEDAWNYHVTQEYLAECRMTDRRLVGVL